MASKEQKDFIKKLKDMGAISNTKSAEKALDKSNKNNKNNNSGGTTIAPKPTQPDYSTGSLANMTRAQAKAAGREAEYNALVSGYLGGNTGGGTTNNPKTTVDTTGNEYLPYKEGDVIPGKGRLLPDGTFAQDTTTTNTASSMTPTDFVKYLTSIGAIASDKVSQDRAISIASGKKPEDEVTDFNQFIEEETDTDKEISDAEDRLQKLREELAKPETDAEIRARLTALFQNEIDALNAVYATQKQEAVKAGLGALGTNRASQARFGLLGSTFGETEVKNINQETLDKQKNIDVANQAALSPIYNKISEEVLAARKEKQTAQMTSAEAYIANLKTTKEKKAQIATNAIKSMILSKANPTDKDFTDMAKQIGVDPALFKQEYLAAKQEEDAAISTAERASLKANADISKPLDVGDYTYVFNQETGAWENQGLNKKAQDSGQMSTRQNVVFNSIITKHNAIDSANATFNVAKETAKRLKTDPKNSQAQLSNLYQYVKTLDSNSAVREGETSLAAATGSLLEQLQRIKEKYLDEGATVGSDLAIKMADEATALADAWLRESQRQKNNLQSQARTNGIEDDFIKTISYAQQLNQDIGKKTIEDYRAEFPGATDEELQALMDEEANQ